MQTRKRTFVTLAPLAPDRTAWMPHPCCSSDVNAASMSYPRSPSGRRMGLRLGLGVAVGVGVGHGQEGVVGFGVADADPGAVAGERADRDALVEAGGGEVQGVLAEAQPDEVGLGRGDVPAVGDQRLTYPGPLLDGELYPLE